jgi:hypothetical protein
LRDSFLSRSISSAGNQTVVRFFTLANLLRMSMYVKRKMRGTQNKFSLLASELPDAETKSQLSKTKSKTHRN